MFYLRMYNDQEQKIICNSTYMYKIKLYFKNQKSIFIRILSYY
jgi:hypothetical protein